MKSETMTAASFCYWLELAREAGVIWNNKDAAERLGVTQQTISAYKRQGAPRTVALACSALLYGHPAFTREPIQ